MSINTGYDQYLRKFRLLITTTATINVVKSIKTVSTAPAVPNVANGTVYTAKVTAKSLNMREGPATKYKSLGTLKKGTKLELLTNTGRWYQATNPKTNSGIVYVYYKYVKVTGTKENAAASTTTQTTETTETTLEKRSLEITKLRCVFNCEKSVSDTPNYSVITVYNMAQDTISSIKAGDTVVLEAGYEYGNFGMIFTGQIVQPYVTREGSTDTALNLVVQDGDMYLNSAFVMTTLSQGASNADVVRATTEGFDGISNGLINSELGNISLPRGKVLFGSAAEYAKQAAIAANSQFYVEDGKVNIVAATDYASNQAVELNPRTGLIDMPGQTDDGVSAKCLINPSLKLNTLVHIDSSLVAQKQVAEGSTEYAAVSTDGIYRIIKLTYKGDTHGDDWYCEFDAVAQAGLTPSGMDANTTSLWR